MKCSARVAGDELNMKRASVLIDLLLLAGLSIVLVSYSFRGVTSLCDGAMHLSKIKILLDNFRIHGYFLSWNPYWYFGAPMWRIYPPLSYYLVVFLSWMLNLSKLEEIVMMWAYMVFSLASMSTYFLAEEMGLKRLGSFISSILFLLSFNLIAYWGSGSYPNVTGVAFSPLVLFFFYRAIKKRNLMNTLAAGLTLSLVILTYFMNAIILIVFVTVVSVLMIVREHSLLYVSRGPLTPPKYTLTLPRILLTIISIAVVLSLWWVLPFLTTYFAAPTVPWVPESGVPDTPRMLEDQLISLLGVYPNIESPGIGQFILATIACSTVLVKRKVEIIDAPICFIVAFIFCLTPWLRIPVGPLFWWRFTLYLSLFAAICGGIAFDLTRGFYDRFLESNFSDSSKHNHSYKIFSFAIVTLTLFVSIYPVLGSESIVFSGLDISQTPEYIRFLEGHAKPGERVGIDGGYDFNLHTQIAQSSGGNIHHVYMTNEFAYTFWRYMFVKQDSRYLSYFARSYNVKWFVGSEMPRLKTPDPNLGNEVYEVIGFNTSLAEMIGPESRLVLFMGDEREYSLFFTSIALSNPEDIIPVYGGNTLDEHDIAILSYFDAVYLSTFKSTDVSRLSRLFSDYVEAGGCLILDTGNVEHEGGTKGLPSSSPVEEVTYEESNLVLYSAISHGVTKGVNLTRFGTEKPYTISHSQLIKEGAVTLVYDDDKPVLVYWERGFGKVFWTGLRLPYMVMLDEDDEAKSGEEAKLLLNLLRQGRSTETMTSRSLVYFEQICPEEIIVHVRNGSVDDDAVWVKMSYYPGWMAEIEDEPHTQLRIFKAGPNMMLVFPQESGDYTVRFYFDKTLDVKVGEYTSLLSVIVLPIAASIKAAGMRKKREALAGPRQQAN